LSSSLRPSLRPSAATLTGVLAAALVPQASDAALVTVGGDGGVGTVTLENHFDSTNIDDVLLSSIRYRTNTFSSSGDLVLATGTLFPAVRSNVSTTGVITGFVWTFFDRSAPNDGAVLNSDDNWVPGHFRVNGVNDGDFIWGWLQVRLGPRFGELNPTIISFTYDDEATDTTPFRKPIGGFSVTETEPVPEPSTLGLFGLGLGAAFVSRMRRRKKNG